MHKRPCRSHVRKYSTLYSRYGSMAIRIPHVELPAPLGPRSDLAGTANVRDEPGRLLGAELPSGIEVD